MKVINFCNKVLEYSFYALFLLVPLAFSDKTYELFEFNKMWLTFALAVIVGTAWCIKMAFLRHVRIQRTPLDIPILLFFLSQIIATIFSLDTHVSLWGYYSRFNGGLLSTISYIVFYYAFVSNFRLQKAGDASGGPPSSARKERAATEDIGRGRRAAGPAFAEASAGAAGPRATEMVTRLLKISIVSGLIVALWGLSSHFGYDPTCFLFRGTLDVSCWTQDFQPKVRIFSTFGQPNWLAAYLAILTPIAIAFAMGSTKSQAPNHKHQNTNVWNFGNWNLFGIWNLEFGAYLLLAVLFYIDLLFTRSQSGFIAVWTAIGLLAALSIFSFRSRIMLLLTTLLLITFGLGLPIGSLEQFTLPRILEKRVEQKVAKKETPTMQERFAGELGGTDSKKIRLIVWRGALDVWRHNPLFGTGVETFAFAYYKHRPQEHNLTSEWDFLYNKAHNEYLNYLANTGLFGLGSYLSIVFVFLFTCLKSFKSQAQNFKRLNFGILELALLAAYVSILVSNFFGFSVVMIQVFFFLIPAFVFVLSEQLDPKKTLNFQFSLPCSPREAGRQAGIFNFQWVIIASLLLTSLYLLITLLRFWVADTAFALGYNLNKTGEYQTAYLKLHEAALQRPQEPVFQDELAFNDAILSVAFTQGSASDAAALAQEAIQVSDYLVATHPNNVVFWKTRVRIFYALGQVDEDYLKKALEAVQRASSLAPTDAKVSYNLGLLYGQTGEVQKAVATLNHTLQLKPNYRDAYYALGLFYKETKEDEKAASSMRYILTTIDPSDEEAKQALKTWDTQ